MAGDDLLRPVKLFEQQPANDKMGPGHGAEAQDQPGVFAHRVAQAIRAADGEGDVAHAVVLPIANLLGKLTAGG